MSDTELETLIDSLLENELSEADFLRLEAELQLDSKARRTYYEKLRIDTLLRTESESAAEIREPRKQSNWRPIAIAAAAAIALFASAASGWFIGKKPTQGTALVPVEEPLAVGFGVVADSADAKWVDDSFSINRGDLLPPGKLRLASGLLKLELFSGVRVIVEGDAEFELKSSMEMDITHGKVRALVPDQAHGFRIHSPSGDLVDLGTEFALEVTPDHADLHVLDGEIEWHPISAEMRQLKEGDSLRWASNGNTSDIAAEGKTIAEVETAFDEQRSRRRSTWLDHVSKTASDPRLLAYFPMHQPGDWQHRLIDASNQEHSATIVQARRVADRWGGSDSALDFSPTGSRARLVIPGSHNSLTFLCWARIDSLDRQFNSLFLTDGHENGEPHWQIMDDGRLFFSVKKRVWESDQQRDKHVFYSPPIWNTSMGGRWMQIATTYDVENRRVCHYVDGKQISNEMVPDGYLVTNVNIGAASIGNWSEPYRSDPGFAVRNLNGAIDEFAIYRDALSPDEIEALYEIGKP